MVHLAADLTQDVAKVLKSFLQIFNIHESKDIILCLIGIVFYLPVEFAVRSRLGT
jgi:hypothetical protein